MYIHHAKNLVEGRLYQDTGYIYNPQNAVIGPQTYPPVFPLLLAPVYYSFGMNLAAMKVAIILVFLLWLSLWAVMASQELSFHLTCLSLFILGFNPFFWAFKEQILSDIPFLLLTSLSLFLIINAHRKFGTHSPLPYGIMAGITCFLAYGTRSIGFVFIPALWLHDLITYKTLTRFTIVITLIVVCLGGLQGVLIHNDSDYLQQFLTRPSQFAHNALRAYPEALCTFWHNGSSKVLYGIVSVLFGGCAVCGYALRIRKNRTFAEIFVVVYFLVVALWPSFQGIRFLIPILPFYILYLLFGLRYLAKLRYSRFRNYAYSLAIVLIVASYSLKYNSVEFGPLKTGIGTPEAQELFAYIRHGTPPDAICMFGKPRVLALFTNRRASAFSLTNELQQYWHDVKTIHATHLIFGKNEPSLLYAFMRAYRAHFVLVFSNMEFTVYRYVEASIHE